MTSIAKMFKIHFLANVLANHKKTACAAVLLAMLSPSIAACQEDPNAPATDTKHHKDKDKDNSNRGLHKDKDIVNKDFETFWQAYPKRKARKTKRKN